MEPADATLVAEAHAALAYAYDPYSSYRVGAAVRWASGWVSAGCNVENASYGLTVCAERVALYLGIARGERQPQALAVAVDDDGLPTPCGACRQVLAEWAEDLPIYLINRHGRVRETSLRCLLPEAFRLSPEVPKTF